MFARKLSTGLAVTLTAIGMTAAQAAPTVEDFQTWSSIIATGNFGFANPELKNVRYWLEGVGRFGNDNSRFSQGMFRVGLGYALNEHASLWLGYGFINTDEPFAAEPFDEHRIWQQLLWTQKTSVGTFSSRSRLEQRFADNGSDVAWRLRQMFKFVYPLPFAQDFSLVGSDEYFVNFNSVDWGPQDGFDQNRLFVGAGYNFTANIRTEVGYMNQYIRRVENPDRMDHILNMNLLLNY